jgi:hypothetical protein
VVPLDSIEKLRLREDEQRPCNRGNVNLDVTLAPGSGSAPFTVLLCVRDMGPDLDGFEERQLLTNNSNMVSTGKEEESGPGAPRQGHPITVQ